MTVGSMEFLDTDAASHDGCLTDLGTQAGAATNKDPAPAQILRLCRPWTKYWPPLPGGDLYNFLLREYPDSITWKFNPKDPFDRPWQCWIRRSSQCSKVPLPTTRAGGLDQEAGCKQRSIDTEKISYRNHGVTNKENDECQPELPYVEPASFNYLANLSLYEVEKPYHSRLPFLDNGLRRSNIIAASRADVKIRDLSGHENKFQIDQAGFEFCKSFMRSDVWSDEKVRKSYINNLSIFLKERFSCQEVHIYTYNFRCENTSRTATEAWIRPFLRAHCDVSERSSVSRLKLHLPHKAADIQKGRYRFIGVWQLLSKPPINCPLGLCDARSIDSEDLIPADVLFPHFCDEGYEVRYNPAHRWYYKGDMGQDDLIIMKLYDSDPNKAQFCAHSAFVDPLYTQDSNKRASLEARAIVIG